MVERPLAVPTGHESPPDSGRVLAFRTFRYRALRAEVRRAFPLVLPAGPRRHFTNQMHPPNLTADPRACRGGSMRPWDAVGCARCSWRWCPSPAKSELMMPPFHGERCRVWPAMQTSRNRTIDAWRLQLDPLQSVYEAYARHHQSTIFGCDEGGAHDALRSRLQSSPCGGQPSGAAAVPPDLGQFRRGLSWCHPS